jgi:hypothetical protein
MCSDPANTRYFIVQLSAKEKWETVKREKLLLLNTVLYGLSPLSATVIWAIPLDTPFVMFT